MAWLELDGRDTETVEEEAAIVHPTLWPSVVETHVDTAVFALLRREEPKPGVRVEQIFVVADRNAPFRGGTEGDAGGRSRRKREQSSRKQ